MDQKRMHHRHVSRFARHLDDVGPVRATSVLARTQTFRSVRDHRTVDPGVAGLNPVGLAQEAQPFGLAFCLLRQTMATDVAYLAALGAPSAVNGR